MINIIRPQEIEPWQKPLLFNDALWLGNVQSQSERYLKIFSQNKKPTKGLSYNIKKLYAKNKRHQFNTWKRIIDTHKAENRYIKLSQCFQVSRTEIRCIKIKSHIVQNTPGRGRKYKISKTLERKLVRNVSKDPRTTSETMVQHLARCSLKGDTD